ncbi:hypothetical protein E7T09_04555 [Deinococcus sp. KSM4-11]|uniref:DprA-like winged helix domain-containing protein n=1 Tax=Deinococcus sp. KSM4-11 TaxID=2568654 RepID=UPI0010A3EA62|nr:hypothetical protein [Deinococcus sp. KSM4-11]THF88482.1 hypothetical protein E7T09_04555 [Deinococcus sp. KSM4-11]
MTTTEAALKASRGPILVDDLAARTGRSPADTTADLTMLEISGKASASGGRWTWTGAAPGIKGGTVRRKGDKRPVPAQPGVASRPRAHIYPIQVVSTRWKDARTGRWVKTPKESTPLRLKVGRASQQDGMVITKIHKRDEATGIRIPVRYRVQFLEARRAVARGELTQAQLRDLEQDIADGLLSEDGQKILEQIERQGLHSAYRSDQATRAAATRKAKVSTKKHRTATQIRTDHLKASNDLKAAQLKLGKAKTSKAQQTHRTRIRNLNLQLGRLVKEAKSAGVTL